MREPYSPALRITLAYLLFAALWIGLSDWAALYFISWFELEPSTTALTELQTLKGWLFVAVTSLLLYTLLRVTFTRLARANARHRQAERRLASLLHHLPHGVEEVDREGTIVYTNPARARILGYTPGEMAGWKIWDSMPAEQRAHFQAYFHHLITETPEPVPWEGPMVCKDGSVRTLRVDWTYLRDEAERVNGFSVVLTDVTAQRQAEAAVREAATVFASAAEGIVIADREWRIRRVNRAFEALTGLTAAEVTGSDFHQLRPPQLPAQSYGQIVATVRRTGRWQGETAIRCKDGATLPGWLSITAVQHNGEEAYHVALFSDLRAVKEPPAPAGVA